MTILRRKFAGGAIGLVRLLFIAGVIGLRSRAEIPSTRAAQPPAAVYKESPTQFKENEGWTVAQPSDSMLRGKWWEIFNDPELNALEEQLNINNQNIKQYFENFMEARAIVREARAQYFPTLAVAPSFSRSRTSANLRHEPGQYDGYRDRHPATAEHASIRCRSKHHGSPIFGARSATPCANRNTPPRSARRISRTSV